MKRRFTLSLGFLVVTATLLVISSFALAAGGFSVPWWTADNGGGSSQGGSYTVTGTIGQHDTGTMSGGPYSLIGGFWNAQGADEPLPPETPEPGDDVYLPLIVR